MKKVAGVRFKGAEKLYYYDARELDLELNDYV